jgi:hypothetical protein
MSYEQTLSANALFHYTKTSDSLESILRNEFYPRYCLENLAAVVPDIKGKKSRERLEIAIPMVSFCDIPLSQIKKHVDSYGHYALGLTKEWGIKNKICPVLYTYNHSELSNRLKILFVKGIEDSDKNKLLDNLLEWLSLIKFVKPYEGYLRKGGKYGKKRTRFYDEREWRFCPNIRKVDQPNTDILPFILSKEEFLKIDQTQKLNKILEKYKLSFEPKDIKYIIINKEDEILEMVDKLMTIKSKYTESDRKVLTTRIIPIKHISEDF